MVSLRLTQSYLSLLLSLGCLGLAIYAFGLFGSLTPTILTVFTLIFTLLLVRFFLISFRLPQRLLFQEKLFLAVLLAQGLLYLLGIFAPEVGFDALWYHLPEAQVYISTGKIAYIPEIFYSLTPRLGEMFLALGLHTAGVIGVKFISFLFGLLFLTGSFLLFRLFLSRSNSLLATSLLYSFPLVAWLSASAYIDLTRAAFETATLLALLLFFRTQNHKHLVFSAALLGFALSTKLVAASFWPLYLILVFFFTHSFKKLFTFTLFSLLPALPWFIDNILVTGNPLFPLASSQASINLSLTGSNSSLLPFFLERLFTLPTLPYHLTFQADSLLSPIFLILFPLIFFAKNFWKKPPHLILFVFTCLYFFIWWFLAYRSTRYLLPLYPLFLVLLLHVASQLPAKYKLLPRLILVASFISIFANFAIRLGATSKYLPLFLGRQSTAQYLAQFKDGNIDEKLDLFYSDYWKKYRYHSPLFR